ncbi:MAG: SDR family oxidoreductase [Chlamydiia bacterium]|nr:SDR family oxidoreductase [Chlamydiia bacterium]
MGWTLVTGGATGLGAEICRHLASKGYPVVVHYRQSKNEAEAVAEQCRSLGSDAATIQGDFSDPGSLQAFAKRYLDTFPETTALINNASAYLVAPLSKTSSPQWEEIYQTNVHAPFFLSTALLPQLRQHQGTIINIGVSGIDTRRADTYSSAYTISKQALCSMTRSLAKELAPEHVRVNMVSPGMLERSQDSLPSLPMGRPAAFAEVAGVVLFLLDKTNSYITGQNIEVAGGLAL